MSNGNRQVLVAEDNAALASVLRFNLERAGFAVTVAHNGRQAWEQAQRQQFDLIVTDQQMPELTGSELCGRLRGLANYDRTPVIMLTAKGLELELDRLKSELGIAATFLKPFSPREIVKTVEEELAAAN